MPAASPTASASQSTAAHRRERTFTGWHMTAIMVTFFAIVFAVNFFMAHLASSTFSGLVVENSYDASQSFNGWLGDAAREKALGWDATATRLADGRVAVRIAPDGKTAVPATATLSAEAKRPLGLPDDRNLGFVRAADGSYVSTAPLAAGRWKLRFRLDGKDTAGHVIAWHDEANV